MPVIRSPRSDRSSRSPLLIPKYVYRQVPGSLLGQPFRSDYIGKYVPEFTKLPNSLQKRCRPKDPRPRPLKLKDLKCTKLLGEGQGQVFLVSSNGGRHYMDLGAVFALKGMRRKHYRTQAPALLPSDESSVNADRRGRYLEKHHSDVNLERSTLASMDWSPFVTGLVQSLYDSQMLYMAIEYIPGGTLRSRLRKANGPLKLADANFYFANLVCALEFLEKQNVVHRDLKPENILIGLDGYLVLTDFGSSSRRDDSICDWKELGTPFYMAPECQLESPYQPQDAPSALDWWSSGCVLYEMVTGKLAFCGANSLVTQMRTLEGVEWPTNIKLGKNLKNLVQQLLEVEPESRLGTDGAEDVKEHPWLASVDWGKMWKKRYLAPYLPKAINPADTWHSMGLPKQSHVPGLPVVEPPIHLAYDNRYPARPFI